MEFTSNSKTASALHEFAVTCPWCKQVETVAVKINASNTWGSGWPAPTTAMTVATVDPKSRVVWRHDCEGPAS